MRLLITLRGEGSNFRPSGYEPDELPLLYLAIWAAKVGVGNFPAKFNSINVTPFLQRMSPKLQNSLW